MTTEWNDCIAIAARLAPSVILDYTPENFVNVLRDYDGAFDLVGGTTLARAFSVVPTTAMKDMGGSIGLAVLFWFLSAPNRLRALIAGVRYRYLFMRPGARDLETIEALVDAKKATR